MEGFQYQDGAGEKNYYPAPLAATTSRAGIGATFRLIPSAAGGPAESPVRIIRHAPRLGPGLAFGI